MVAVTANQKFSLDAIQVHMKAGVPAAPTPVIWDTSHLSGTGFVASNSDRTATMPDSTGIWGVAVGTLARNDGVRYLECKYTSSKGAGTNIFGTFGFCKYPTNLSGYVATGNYLAGITTTPDTRAFFNGFIGQQEISWVGGTGSFTNYGGLTPTINHNDVLGLLFDFTNGELYVAINNVWTVYRASSDPLTRTNPVCTWISDSLTFLPILEAFTAGGWGDFGFTISGTASVKNYDPPAVTGVKWWGDA